MPLGLVLSIAITIYTIHFFHIIYNLDGDLKDIARTHLPPTHNGQIEIEQGFFDDWDASNSGKRERDSYVFLCCSPSP